MPEQSSVQSVGRAFKIIELLCEKGELGITELSSLSGLNKTTVFRFLSTLSALGYVRKRSASEKYALTLKFLRLSADMLSKIDIRRYARTFLEQIPKITGETAHLVERSGNDIVYIDKFESAANSVSMVSRVGLSLPMVYTAVGKAIMARLSDGEIRQIWDSSDVEAKTERTITDFNQFMREIGEVRKNGYAADREENERGVCCVAAAVPDIYGEYRYAFSVSAPSSRMNDENISKIGALVIETGRKIASLYE